MVGRRLEKALVLQALILQMRAGLEEIPKAAWGSLFSLPRDSPPGLQTTDQSQLIQGAQDMASGTVGISSVSEDEKPIRGEPAVSMHCLG